MANNRTEKPTPKRREDARRKGQIARRPEFPAAAGFLAALLTLRLTGDHLLARAGNLFTTALTHVGDTEPLTISKTHLLLLDASLNLALLSLPVIAAAMTAGIVINFAQGGLTWTPKALLPRAERFNPVANFKRALGSNGGVEFVKGIFKLGGLAAICYSVFARALAETPALTGAPAAQIFTATGALVYDLGLRAGTVLLLLAALDYGYGWYKHEKSLRMTKQEIRDEFRQQEGDPLVKSQRRRAARALLQRQLMVEVPRADVVITNPTHFAVALRYDREQEAAPMVVAKGADFMAQRIREIARAHEVAIVENPPLARALFRAVKPGRVIPQAFFRAVAEVLAYVYRRREQAAAAR
jgi:flagellar biosynthetic protein FlhB